MCPQPLGVTKLQCSAVLVSAITSIEDSNVAIYMHIKTASIRNMDCIGLGSWSVDVVADSTD